MEGKRLKCPECSGPIVFPEGISGEKVCGNCGLVNGITYAHNFSQWTPKWPSNWNKQDSKTLREWLTALRLVSCQLNLPNFPYREEAARLLRKKNGDLSQSHRFSKNKRETVAALLQLILNEYGKERSTERICKQLGLDSKLVMKQIWILKENLRAEKKLLKTRRRSSKEYLYEYGGRITNNNEVLLKAEETLRKVKRKGGNPISLAAGALYYACKKHRVRITKKIIGKTFAVSDRTVDTNERKIRRFLTSVPPLKL